jgi:hypothetical protein
MYRDKYDRGIKCRSCFCTFSLAYLELVLCRKYFLKADCHPNVVRSRLKFVSTALMSWDVLVRRDV